MDTTSLTAWQASALEAVQAAFKAGYDAGRKDALANILRAAEAGLAATGPSPENKAVPVPQPEGGPILASGRAKPGSVKQVVREFVLRATVPVIERELAKLHPEINRSSRYMAFRTLAEEGVIMKQGDAWVPAPKGAGKPGNAMPGFFNLEENTEAADGSAS